MYKQNDKIYETVKNNLKILVNKSVNITRSKLAASDMIRNIEKLNLTEVCFYITRLIFNEEIIQPQKAGDINESYTFSIIDMDELIFGLFLVYKNILSKVKLSKLEKQKNRNIILRYIEENKIFDPDNNNPNYEKILNLFN